MEPTENKKHNGTWETIVRLVVTILTAVATTLGMGAILPKEHPHDTAGFRQAATASVSSENSKMENLDESTGQLCSPTPEDVCI